MSSEEARRFEVQFNLLKRAGFRKPSWREYPKIEKRLDRAEDSSKEALAIFQEKIPDLVRDLCNKYEVDKSTKELYLLLLTLYSIYSKPRGNRLGESFANEIKDKVNEEIELAFKNTLEEEPGDKN